MTDRFLEEIHRLHETRANIKALSRDSFEQFTAGLSEEESNQWMFRARDAQLPPINLDWCWLFMAGRGAGKTRAMSGVIHTAIRAGLGRVHLIAPTTADSHDVNLDGPSGILRTAPADALPKWFAYKRRLEWPNGAVCVFFSAEEPESLRGPQCELCVAQGQLVTMADGSQKAIEVIAAGDIVATPIGSQRVLWSGLTRCKAETIEIIAGKNNVRVTPDHKIYVEGKGWTKAARIRKGDQVVIYGMASTCGDWKKVSVITDIISVFGELMAGKSQNGFMFKFTKIILGLFRKATTSIIRIITVPTMMYRIWNCCHIVITAVILTGKFIQQNVVSALVNQWLRLSQPNHGSLLYASNAVKHFFTVGVGYQNFVTGDVNTPLLDVVRRIVQPLYDIMSVIEKSWPKRRGAIVRAVESSMPIDCYDLRINQAHCFYAGGILVHNCVIDEIARMRYQASVFDNAMLGLRLGDKPRLMIATTPRPTQFMRKLVAMEGVSITTGTTYDNSAHLAPDFLKKIREIYEGTRIGRQELQGAMLLDPAHALFKDDWLLHDEIPEEAIEQVTVGVDPSGGGDDVGIIVSALLSDGRYAVLADRTTGGSPAQWGDAVIKAHDDFKSDDIVVEINFGGDLATEVIKQAAIRAYQAGARDTDLIRIREVAASRGKAMRAEPISLLYEKQRVLHRRGLDKLEAEMMSFSREWSRDIDGSPNRLDAMVWAITRLSKVITDVPIA